MLATLAAITALNVRIFSVWDMGHFDFLKVLVAEFLCAKGPKSVRNSVNLVGIDKVEVEKTMLCLGLH